MKYYLPTSTLNFDCILSSQKIFPPLMYKSGVLWWNQFELTSGDDGRAIVLYSKCPDWTIDDCDRDNYPMVVEVDRAFKRADIVELNGLKAVVLYRPIEFSQLDVAQGRIRFLFRNEKEKCRIVGKTFIGVSECKISLLVEGDYSAICDLMPTAKKHLCKLCEVNAELRAKLAGVDGKSVEESASDYREERERGAELGYRVGLFVKTLRLGSFIDAFRVPLTFAEWQAKILPKPFSLILHKFCSRGAMTWNPNRVAIVDLCTDVWYECFKDKEMDGSVVEDNTKVHLSLRRIAEHWANPEVDYKVKTEKNVYMQSYAAFLECGTSVAKYLHFANDLSLKCPEYLFSLYGAVVGYTYFSRALLDVRAYSGYGMISQVPVASSLTKVSIGRPHGDSESKTNATRIVAPSDNGSSVTHLEQLPKQQSVGRADYKQTYMNLGEVENANQMEMHNELMLVDDPSLIDEVRREFAQQMIPEKLDELINFLRHFSKAYLKGGFYGKNPDKYKRENPDLISHLMNCMLSKNNAMKLNFEWDSTDVRHKFETFLNKRYIRSGR